MERTSRHAQRARSLVAALGVAVAAAGCSSGSAGPAWTAITDRSAFAAGTVHDVTSNGTGFVAVGSVIADGAPKGAIWTSPDGGSWMAQAVDAPNETFLHVGHVGTALVAISSQCAGGGECVGSSFWSSPDGTTWTEQGDYQDMSYLVALANGPFGVAVVGADWSTGYPQNPADVAAYVSADGTTWTRSPNGAGMTAATMGAVATGGPGLVALGNTGPNLTAWSSPDGRTWTTATSSSGLGSGEVRQMVQFGTRLVAVGRDGQDAVAWVSSDGTTWTRSARGASPLQASVMEGVASTASMLVAVGQDHAAGVGAIWTSTDGATWTKAGSLPGGSVDLGTVALSGTTLVAFGRAGDGSVVILRAETHA
jgi:hypothetical protein